MSGLMDSSSQSILFRASLPGDSEGSFRFDAFGYVGQRSASNQLGKEKRRHGKGGPLW
jgi:hypothetical protein